MKVVVFSYDGYHSVIDYFLHFYKMNWADNPYATEIVTEEKDVDGWAVYKTGKMPWADRAIKYLAYMQDSKFLLLLSDYILNVPVDTAEIQRAEAVCTGDVGCVRVHAHNHECVHLVDNGMVGYKKYPLDKPYAVSLMTSVWQTEFFLEFLKAGESIWQTEIEGSKRIINSKKSVLWADKPGVSHHPHGYMCKGKVVKSVEQWVKENW